MARTGDLAEAVCFMSMHQPGLYLAMDREELALRPYSTMAFDAYIDTCINIEMYNTYAYT